MPRNLSEDPRAVSVPWSGRRDERIDFLRGLSLLFIFIDHIPGNQLSQFTLQNFGFSDSAEIFVILAGFSAVLAYNSVLDREGFRACQHRLLSRCVKIYCVHAVLLLATILIVTAVTHLQGTQSSILGPMMRDGLSGTLRGLLLMALPTYLDILPLYLILLLSFPTIMLGLKRKPWLTLATSAAIYLLANLFHLNLPNVIDPNAITTWYFNPLAWQFIFVLGAALALARKNDHRLFATPPSDLKLACWAYLAFALLAENSWHLWLPPVWSDLPYAFWGNHPKTFVTPWRLAHVLALAYLALTSVNLAKVARYPWLKPVLACGSHSLPVFAAGCLLSLLGRVVFRYLGVAPVDQLLVNLIGLSFLLWFGWFLDQSRPQAIPVRQPQALLGVEAD